MRVVKTPCLQDILISWSFSWSAERCQLSQSAVAVTHPLQTVQGHVCKVMVLHKVVLLGPRTLFPHLISMMLILSQGFLQFIIVSLVVHAPKQVPPLAEYSKLTWSVCRMVSMARFASEAELKAFLGKLDADYAEYASALWCEGLKTPRQLANFTEPHYLACGVRRGHIDDIKASVDTTGELLACNTL